MKTITKTLEFGNSALDMQTITVTVTVARAYEAQAHFDLIRSKMGKANKFVSYRGW